MVVNQCRLGVVGSGLSVGGQLTLSGKDGGVRNRVPMVWVIASPFGAQRVRLEDRAGAMLDPGGYTTKFQIQKFKIQFQIQKPY